MKERASKSNGFMWPLYSLRVLIVSQNLKIILYLSKLKSAPWGLS